MDSEILHPAQTPLDDLLADCQVRRQRRSGPGGQHRNKVATGVFLLHEATGVEAGATERRSQADNQRVAIRRLVLSLAVEVRSERLGQAAPTLLWRSRCRNGRVAVNPNHVDFAPLLAEALDVLLRHRYDVILAAEQLGCTASQLLKLLRDEPRAWQLLNEERRSRGLHAMQ